jgi:hypothetical protein
VLVLLAALPLKVLAQVPPPTDAPLSAEEEVSLQEIRDFVRAAARRYRMVAPLEVSVASWVGSGSLPQYANTSAVYASGYLYVHRRVLRASNRDLVIAKAIAYEMLRVPSKATTLAERERERGALTLDSNARAVDVLVQVKGVSEEAAVGEMYAWLLAIHRGAGIAGRPRPAGAVTPCDQIADLLERYPAVKARYADRQCVAG